MQVRFLVEYPLDKGIAKQVYQYIKNWFNFDLEGVLSVEFPPSLYFRTGELDSNSVLNFINSYQIQGLLIVLTKSELRDGLRLVYGKNRCNRILVSTFPVEKTERVAKVVLHELGHYYGLKDSSNRKCFMGVCGLPKEDFLRVLDSVSDFCDSCKERLRKVKEFIT